MKNLQNQQVQKGISAKSLRILIFIQVVIAIIAVIIIAVVSFKIQPLIEQRQKLILEIKQKEAKKDTLDKIIISLEEQTSSLQGALSRIDQTTIKTALESMVEENTDAMKVIPRIYIHIFSIEQRNKAKEISNELSKAGFIVPGVQRVNIKIPISQVRYFRTQDKSEAPEFAILSVKKLQSSL